MRILFGLIILLIISTSYSQQSPYYRTKGNLIRVPFSTEIIDLGDTIGSTVSESLPSYFHLHKYYLNAFSWNGESFFIRQVSSYHDFLGGFMNGTTWTVDRLSDHSTNTLYDFSGDCGTHWYYEYMPVSFREINNQLWIQSGATGNMIIRETGEMLSTYSQMGFNPEFIAYIGNVDGLPVVVCRGYNWNDFCFYQIDKPGFPDTVITRKNFRFDRLMGNPESTPVFPESITQITDDLFLVTNQVDPYGFSKEYLIASRTILDDSTDFVGSYKDSGFPKDHFGQVFLHESGKAHMIQSNQISEYQFQNSDSTFALVEHILTLPSGKHLFTDISGNHATWIKNDTLFLFNTNEKRVINQWYTGSIKVNGSLLIDDTAIYIPQETSHQIIVSVEPEEKHSPFLVSAYPNPFNPETTIRITTGKSETGILTVYDMSGRIVWQSGKQQLHAGTNELKVKPTGWASGMYLLRVEAGAQAQTVKLIFSK